MNNTTTTMPTRTRQVDGLTIRYADTDAASGAHDDLVPPSNGRYLVQQLPDSRLSILDTGHFAGSRSPTSTPPSSPSGWPTEARAPQG